MWNVEVSVANKISLEDGFQQRRRVISGKKNLRILIDEFGKLVGNLKTNLIFQTTPQ
jgi:hypothetical protein